MEVSGKVYYREDWEIVIRVTAEPGLIKPKSEMG